MIHLYTAATPNGQKAAIMLEEIGLPYEPHLVALGKREQKQPDFLARNPNGKIPVIVDRGEAGEVTVSESGAILIYLAEKAGQLLPSDPAGRAAVFQWLMFQMAGVGPMFGQAGSWRRAETKVQPAIDRYADESRRLLGVLDGRLAASPYLGGTDYSIADIATWPWINALGFLGLDLDATPAIKRWHGTIGEREAVKRGMAVAPRG